MTSLNSWIKKNLVRNVISRYAGSDCPKEQHCLGVLELILDGEATEEQMEGYFDHIDMCWTCFQNYDLEKSIRELIKTRVENKEVPADLTEKIKSQINQINNKD